MSDLPGNAREGRHALCLRACREMRRVLLALAGAAALRARGAARAEHAARRAAPTTVSIAARSCRAGHSAPLEPGRPYEGNAYAIAEGQAALRLVQLQRLPRATAAAASGPR